MKTTKTRGITFLAFLLGMSILSTSMSLYAQEDSLLQDTDDVLNSDQIDIDGLYNKKSPIEAAREKLQKQTNDMVDNKVETMRLKSEKKIGNDILNMFSGKSTDSVSTANAATQKVEAKIEEKKAFEEIKVIPQVGGSNIRGEDFDWNTTITGGISIESMVSNRIAFGLGFNFMTLTATEIDNYGNLNNYYTPGGYNQYDVWRTNTYGQGRDLDYKNLGLELNTKVFATVDTRIKPYLGLGIGYNRASLKYTDQGQIYNYSYNNAKIGDEGVTTNFVSAAASLGAEAIFTKNFGMNLELKYQRSVTEFNKKAQASYIYNPDQERLNRLAAAIQGSDVITVQAGIVVAF